jgi:hypothetical protein
VVHQVDEGRYRASVARLHEIFRGMSEAAESVSSWRCPYKNVQDRCTANFGCRNQDRSVPAGELYICTGSDKLDYRSAWEV